MITTILNGVKFQKRARLSGYVAEMAGAFVCASLGIVPTVRHADYIGSWLELCSPRHNCSYPQQPIMRRKAAAPPENRRNQLLRTGFAQHYFLPDLCCRFDKQRNQ